MNTHADKICDKPGAPMPRRAFLRALARGLVAGSLLAALGALVAKHGRETCQGNGICRGCPEFTDCGLPQALSAKAVISQENR